MKRNRKAWACLAVSLILFLTACEKKSVTHIIVSEDNETQSVSLFSPMEKTKPNAENIARSAFDATIRTAEEALGLTVAYRTYTAEDYQDKTYDDVTLDRARSNMDDIYLLNPDTIQTLGEEGLLMDLSGLESAKNLRDAVKAANTINGKLVAIPQEVVAYGLFINMDIFKKCGLRGGEVLFCHESAACPCPGTAGGRQRARTGAV